MSQGDRQTGQGEAPDKEDPIMPTSSPITMPYYFGALWLPTYSADVHTAGTSEFKEFNEKLQAVFRLYPLNEQQKVEILIGQLKGTAWHEVNSWPLSQKKTATDILERLAKIFDSRTLSELMLHFYARKQQPDETLREFALGLHEALQDIKAFKPEEIIQEDETLVSQFVEGVYGDQMKTYLKMLRLQDPTSSFLDFKETAIKILGTSNRQVQTTSFLETAIEHNQSVATENLLVALKEQVAELIQGMTYMCKEIKCLKEGQRRVEKDSRCDKRPCYDSQCDETGNYRKVTNKFEEQGQPICRHCQKSGHGECDCHQQENLFSSPEAIDQVSGRKDRINPLLKGEQPRGMSFNPVVQNQIKAISMPPAVEFSAGTTEKVLGKVVWFHVKRGYGFINRKDNKKDIFVHYTGIQKNKRRKCFQSLRNGETVEFNVVKGEKGAEAVNVTGPGGSPVQSSKNEAYCNHSQCYSHCRGPPLNYQQDCLPSDGRDKSKEIENPAEDPQQPYPTCDPCPNIQVQGALRESVTGQQIEKQSGSMQQSFQGTVRLQLLQEQPCHIETSVKGTHSRTSHLNHPDMLATNGKKNTEGITNSAMAERVEPPEQNHLVSVRQKSESFVPEKSHLGSKEIALIMQKVFSKSGKRAIGAPSIQHRQ